MDGTDRRERLRSFLIGGALGAAGAIAAGRRLRPRPKPRQTAAGLAAFEGAPCYRETVARERSADR